MKLLQSDKLISIKWNDPNNHFSNALTVVQLDFCIDSIDANMG